jgi:serine/threonine protein kinase
MVFGVPPYFDKNTTIMYNKILNEHLSFPIQVSKELRHLLEGLLSKNPSSRIGNSKGIDEIK